MRSPRPRHDVEAPPKGVLMAPLLLTAFSHRPTIANMQTHTQMPERLAYSINEASAMLGISRWSTYQLIRRGDLHSVRIGARQRIPAEELTRIATPQECAA